MKEEALMVLKVKLHKHSKFVVRDSARLFNDKEMNNLVEMLSTYVRSGCEVKVEIWGIEK